MKSIETVSRMKIFFAKISGKKDCSKKYTLFGKELWESSEK